MFKTEYVEYEATVDAFFKREGLSNLSTAGDVEPFFSWRACDCCNRPEGGDRYECNGYNPTTKKVQDGYTVCPDCVYYAEYGRLDDTTMMEVEK